MPKVDKNEVIAELETGIRAIDRILIILDDLKIGASFADRKKLVKVMADLSDRRQSAAAMVSHLKAAGVEVAPAPNGAYADLDAALKKLQEYDMATNDLKKAMHIASAIGKAMQSTREGVSQRTV